MTDATTADFDVIDRFLVAHGLELEVRRRGDGPVRLELARKLVAIDVPRDELVRWRAA